MGWWRGVLAVVALGVAPVAAATQPVKIVGGLPATQGDWPDAGALVFGNVFACSSVLVAPDVVLTAAHCIGSPSTDRKEVRLDTVDWTLEDGERIAIVEQYGHPDPFGTFDVAVFVLERPATTPHRPLLLDCLVEDWLVAGSQVSIVGFGATDEAGVETTTQLNEGTVEIWDPACDQRSAGCNSAVAPDGELIAGAEGVDTCVGDSGGPLYLETPEGTFLAGVTSRAAQPRDTPCGNGGIYVRADAIADWIEEVTGRRLERPACGEIDRPPEPTAPGIEVELGEQACVTVDPGDPNPRDRHVFELTSGPRLGLATIDEAGRLCYSAPGTLPYDSVLQVTVTDDDGLSGVVAVPVDVLGDPPRPLPLNATGCGGSPSTGWAVLFLGPLLLRRRVNRARCRTSPSSFVD